MAHAHQADFTWIDGRFVRDAIVTVGDDGRIASIGTGAVGDQTVERLRGRLLMPGFVNAHSHAFQRLIRGRTEANPPGGPGDFWVWREAMYRAVDRLTPESVEAVARLAFVEMVAAGWTHVVEFHYVHHQVGGRAYRDRNELARRVLAAAEFAGLGITLLKVAYQRGGAGVPAAGGQLRFVDDLDAYARSLQDLQGERRDGLRAVRVGMAAHSVRAVDGAYLRGLAELGDPDTVLHAHVAEQPREIEECVAETGRRPVELLADCGLLGPRFTGVHATHLGPGEAALLAHSGVCVCPTTERNLGDGLPDLGALLAAGATLSLGSDSQARIDPFAEARGLEDGERLRTGRRVVLAGDGGTTAEAVLAAATMGGARAAGLGGGGIVVGGRADLVSLRLDANVFAGSTLGEGADEAVAGALVLGGHAGLVDDVWVGGHRVVEGGRHPGMAEAVRGYEAVVEAVFR